MVLCISIFSSCKKNSIEELHPFSSLIVYTEGVTNVQSNSAVIVGKLEMKGDGNVTKAGFCWDTVANFMSKHQSVEVYEATGLMNNQTKAYSKKIELFERNKKYYVRAYAEVNGEMIYGNELSFQHPKDFVNSWIFNKMANHDISLIYNSELDMLTFISNKSPYDNGQIMFFDGIKANKVYTMVSGETALLPNQAKISNLIVGAKFYSSVGGKNSKLYTKSVNDRIVIEFKDVELKNIFDNHEKAITSAVLVY